MVLRRVLALALLCHGVIARPPGLSGEQPPAKQALAERSDPRKLHGRFLHITDIHPDEYYKVHSSTDEDDGCHRGRGPAGPYGAETSDCDSPFSLVNSTFDWIADNLKDKIDFVVWTGDSARHDRDETLPRNQDQVLGTNIWIADKFAEVFSGKDGQGMTIPVVPNFGNNDILPHNILLPGPNKWFRHYTHIWRHFIPEEQRHSFQFGGWFHVEVIPNKLAVFSLNTLYLFDRNAGVDGCAAPSEPGYMQFEWLRVQLQIMRERGMKAILIGHVPPARTESKQLWDETCWQKYSLWMHKFRDVVITGLYGHMNIDHFLIHDKKDIDIRGSSGASEISMREAMEDELSVQLATDYLVDLREEWANLTPPPTAGKPKESGKGGRRERGKKHKDPWGERYHLSMVSPSIVPTYFPTLRVFEYNITGIEDNPVWSDALQTTISHDVTEEEHSQKHLSLRHLASEAEDEADTDTDLDATKKKKNKKKKNKKKPKPNPHDPNLIVPSPPSKSSPPGPAYSPQPLTLTGYTQYFANLTFINNLNLTTPSSSSSSFNPFSLLSSDADSDSDSNSWLEWLLRWRRGKHGGKKPAPAPHPPRPREFAFEVEYSTFEDKVLKLGDLTVNSFVELAVRIGQRVGGKSGEAGVDSVWEEDEEVNEAEWGCDEEDDVDEEEEDSDEDSDGEVEKKKGKKKKGRKGKGGKKKKGKENKTWLHFLKHAFVGTLEKDDFEKFT